MEDFIEINCVAKELNEDFIKEMTILKLKKNYGFIEREEFKEEVIALGIKYGFSDYAEFLSRMECSRIRLITIQPNLDLCSIYETTIERMLHEYDFGL